MAHSMSSAPSRSTSHLDRYKFGKSSDSAPSAPLRASKTPEQPVGGERLSRSCGVHDDAGPLPPLRR
jgi:hypothetical protein